MMLFSGCFPAAAHEGMAKCLNHWFIAVQKLPAFHLCNVMVVVASIGMSLLPRFCSHVVVVGSESDCRVGECGWGGGGKGWERRLAVCSYPANCCCVFVSLFCTQQCVNELLFHLSVLSSFACNVFFVCGWCFFRSCSVKCYQCF